MNPMLSFEVPHAFRFTFAVCGVRMRRISRYRSVLANSMLNISEVRELQMFDSLGEGCTVWKIMGCTETDTQLLTEGHKWFYIWHEVSISCPDADKLFEQNKIVELGEEAPWDFEKLSNINAIQSLYIPACEMLKQMDGVGFYNDNGAEASSARNAQRFKKETPYYFW